MSSLIYSGLRRLDRRYGYLGRELFWYGDNLFNISKRYIYSFFISSEPIKIDIKFKNLERLRKIRDKAFKTGTLVRENNDEVKAILNYKDTIYPVRLRLKGDFLDHLLGEKWSFRVKTKSEDSFLGMREFSLQHPRTRNYINEFSSTSY